jgi:hypothetical protein
VHIPAVIEKQPQARQRTFTVAHAGRLATWLLGSGVLDVAVPAEHFPADDPRSQVAPLALATDRAHWVVSELDAARGLAAAVPAPEQRRGVFRRRSAEGPHPDDIPDPHELGAEWHAPAALIVSAVDPLVEVLRRADVRSSDG